MMKVMMGMMAAALFLVGLAGPVHAQVTLRYSPQDTTLAPGETGRLSIHLDEALDVRTIDVRVSFDPAVVRSLGGTGGQLYIDSGFQLFQSFENSAPGEWYGFTVVIGSDDFITGPGELYRWDFEALAEGISPVTDVQTYMSAPGSVWYPDVTIGPTTIVVDDPVSAVTDLPVMPADLRIWPNPFNPRANVGFTLETSGNVRLAVYDAAGRRVADLFDGPATAGPQTFRWDGRDDRGAALAGGLYLFRLTTDRGIARARGILLK
jgi:hypothetical protein